MNVRPDSDERARPIRFGTSGWRGVLGGEFTFARARAVVEAVASRVAARGRSRSVVVAHDRRFLGARLAAEAAATIAAAGLRPLLLRGAVPTPVAAHEVRRRGAAAGIVFTASHNPPEYQGLKLFDPDGAGAGPVETRAVERAAARRLAVRRRTEPGEAPASVAAERGDARRAYVRDLLRLLDVAALRRARLHVVYDAMHGAGAGVLDGALEQAGARVRVLRGAPDPTFGGAAPDPRPARLAELRAAVRAAARDGLVLGIASDGDADRFALVDSDGAVISEADAAALLIDVVARTRRIRGAVALTCATGGLVERVARHHGLAIEFQALGFKHLSPRLVSGHAELAADESGGFAYAPFAHDKDGMLAGGLAAELVASDRAPLRHRLAALRRRLGASANGRTDVPSDLRARRALARLGEAPPERVGRAHVREVVRRDGLRLSLDDGFLMLRASGTEPLVRVYADAPTPRALAARLALGVRLLQRS